MQDMPVLTLVKSTFRYVIRLVNMALDVPVPHLRMLVFVHFWDEDLVFQVPPNTTTTSVVVLIGWDACLVPELDDENQCDVVGISDSVLGECWVMKNSWRSKHGY
jgi:hypothetical protein